MSSIVFYCPYTAFSLCKGWDQKAGIQATLFFSFAQSEKNIVLAEHKSYLQVADVLKIVESWYP